MMSAANAGWFAEQEHFLLKTLLRCGGFVVVVVLFLFYILFIFEAHLGLDPAASTMGVEFAEKEQWDKQEMNAASSQPVPQPSWSDFFSISLREMKH